MATTPTSPPSGIEKLVRPESYDWDLPDEKFLANLTPEDRSSYLQAKLAFQQKRLDFLAAADAAWAVVTKPYTDYDAADADRNKAVGDVLSARAALETAIKENVETAKDGLTGLDDAGGKAAVTAVQAKVDALKAALTALAAKNAALVVAGAALDKAKNPDAAELAISQYDADVMKAIIAVEAAHDALNIKVTQVSQTARDFKIVPAAGAAAR